MGFSNTIILAIAVSLVAAVILKFLISKSSKMPSLSKHPRELFNVIESDNIVDIKYKDVGFMIFTTVFYTLTYFMIYLAVLLPIMLAREGETSYGLENIKIIGSFLSSYKIGSPYLDVLLLLVGAVFYVGLLFIVPRISRSIHKALSRFGGDKGLRWYKVQFTVFIFFASLISILNLYTFGGMSLVGALITFVSAVVITLFLILILLGSSPE